jgi:predicted DNA-binding protein with PD1-like motif
MVSSGTAIRADAFLGHDEVSEKKWLNPVSGAVTAHTFRIPPNEPLMPSLKAAAASCLSSSSESSECRCAFILTAVGSLSSASLRLANHESSRSASSSSDEGPTTGTNTSRNDVVHFKEQRFEIVSLVGTFAPHDNNKCHVHISISDKDGKTFGGHLLDGTIFTTLELVMGTAQDVEYVREMDTQTGFLELRPKQISQENDIKKSYCAPDESTPFPSLTCFDRGLRMMFVFGFAAGIGMGLSNAYLGSTKKL